MVILATRIYGDQADRARQSLETIVDDLLADLHVEYDIGVRHDDFATVTIEGDDAVAARNLLAERFGEIPSHLEVGQTYRGVLEDWDVDGFTVNVGEPIYIPTESLGLGQGDGEQLATRFGLVTNLPMEIVYDEEPTLAESTLDRLYGWRRGPGRVTANGVTRGQLRATVNRAGHAHDIRTIERLGILEQSIICEEDTDPPGLLASIGSFVSGDLACVLP